MLAEAPYTVQHSTQRIIEFKGLNKNHVVAEGELHDMKNMTSDETPCLYQRKARGSYDIPSAIVRPVSMISRREKLALIGQKSDDSYAFYYGDEEQAGVASVASAIGRPLGEDTIMVAINSKIVFFPQKIYFDVVDGSSDSLDAAFVKPDSLTTPADVTVDKDGTLYTTIEYPAAATGVDLTSFKVGDAVNIEGELVIQITEGGSTRSIPIEYFGDNKLSCILTAVGEKMIGVPDETFIEMSEYGVRTAKFGMTTMTREAPDLDYVMEYNNRLWGACNADNTIYACKLGDPTNWQYYQNTSLDSYYAQQGTDGEFTGCAAYSGHMIFFKEHCMHKIYGTSPASYQIVTATAHGVEKGSSRSVAIINDTVMYKSTLGIMAYEGGSPYLISQKFGTSKVKDVVAGTDGIKYYASIIKETDSGEENWMVVCDIDRGLWHKEDNTRARDFCFHDGKLMFVNTVDADGFEANKLYVINADNPLATEDNLEWFVEFGAFDEFVEEKKIYSKLAFRLKVEEGTVLDFYIKMDNGDWEYLNRITHQSDLALTVPVVPRRCNRFWVKIEGKGRARIESLARQYRVGTRGMM